MLGEKNHLSQVWQKEHPGNDSAKRNAEKINIKCNIICLM